MADCTQTSPESVSANGAEDDADGDGGKDIQKLLLEQQLKGNDGMTQFSPGLRN